MPPPGMLNVPPKTPVCIGQLTVTALVLYPISYLQTPPIAENVPEAAWATVRLQHDPIAKQRSPNSEETVHIKTPPTRTAAGEILVGENFGVVEQKVATVLGPMLGKGLIRIDAKVRRGSPNVSHNYHPCLRSEILSNSVASYFTFATACTYAKRQHTNCWSLFTAVWTTARSSVEYLGSSAPSAIFIPESAQSTPWRSRAQFQSRINKIRTVRVRGW